MWQPIGYPHRVSRLSDEQDRWRLHPGVLLIVDEASLSETRTRAHLTDQVQAVPGAKILLVGGPAQVGAVEVGVAFAMLVNRGPTARPPTLRRSLGSMCRPRTPARVCERHRHLRGAPPDARRADDKLVGQELRG